MTSTGTGPPKRETYRHGDLRRALLAAGMELARDGGPEAVVLREATRRAWRQVLRTATSPTGESSSTRSARPPRPRWPWR